VFVIGFWKHYSDNYSYKINSNSNEALFVKKEEALVKASS